MILTLAILIYLALAGACAYRAFARDKQYAEANRGIPRGREHASQRVQRTPEADLLFYAKIGGWPGAKYAQSSCGTNPTSSPLANSLTILALCTA